MPAVVPSPDQLPIFAELAEAPAPPAPAAPPHPATAARRPDRAAAEGGHPRRWPAADRGGRRHRQDDGHHPAHRVADRREARQAVRDPGADLHRSRRAGDDGARRSAGAVRLHRHRDQHLPRLRRPAAARARPRGRPLRPLDGAVSRGAGDLPARAPVRAAPGPIPPARATRPASCTPWSRSSAAPATRTSRRPTTWRPRAAWPLPPRPTHRRGAGRAGCPAVRAGGAVRGLRAADAAPTTGSTSATRSASRCACCATIPPCSPRSASASATSWSTSSRTRTTPSSSWSSCWPARATANVTVVGDDDQSIYRFRGAALSNILGFRAGLPACRPAWC